LKSGKAVTLNSSGAEQTLGEKGGGGGGFWRRRITKKERGVDAGRTEKKKRWGELLPVPDHQHQVITLHKLVETKRKDFPPQKKTKKQTQVVKPKSKRV